MISTCSTAPDIDMDVSCITDNGNTGKENVPPSHPHQNCHQHRAPLAETEIFDDLEEDEDFNDDVII